MEAHNDSLEGKTCLISGAGNVAIYTIEKLYQLGARPLACSDSSGTLYDANGINLEALKALKEQRRASLREYLDEYPEAEFIPVADYPQDGHAVWRFKADAAFPCATQNELTEADARALLDSGCRCVSEGANMPSTPEAVELFLANRIHYGPGKAANAGGVATSQLEMSQNASMQHWTFEQVDQQLKAIMADIHSRCSETAKEFDQPHNLMLGANIAGFRRVADAMLEQGVV